MHITPGLGIYWREADRAQIGLDPRSGVLLEGLTASELSLVDSLTGEQSDIELRERARKLHISPARLREICSMLSKAGVVTARVATSDRDLSIGAFDDAASMRTRHRLPERRRSFAVQIMRANALGVFVASGLAQAGVGLVFTNDTTPISAIDHPELSSAALGLPRNGALRTVLRRRNPHIRVDRVRPDLIVLTGSHALDPILIGEFLAQNIPVIQVWTEEMDVWVGPLSIPHESACGACMYLYRAESDPMWHRLAPQALGARDLNAETSTMMLASALTVREVLNFIDDGTSLLTHKAWQLGPAPAMPLLHQVDPHPKCSCAAQNTGLLPRQSGTGLGEDQQRSATRTDRLPVDDPKNVETVSRELSRTNTTDST